MKSLLSASFLAIIALIMVSTEESAQPPAKINLMASNVVVVQYNAGWNAVNTVKGLENLNKGECTYFYCDVEKQPMFLTSQKVKQVPTVIVYSKGKEVKRWEGDLFMKNSVTFLKVQDVVSLY
mgnify:CR=1 FL=1